MTHEELVKEFDLCSHDDGQMIVGRYAKFCVQADESILVVVTDLTGFSRTVHHPAYWAWWRDHSRTVDQDLHVYIVLDVPRYRVWRIIAVCGVHQRRRQGIKKPFPKEFQPMLSPASRRRKVA